MQHAPPINLAQHTQTAINTLHDRTEPSNEWFITGDHARYENGRGFRGRTCSISNQTESLQSHQGSHPGGLKSKLSY